MLRRTLPIQRFLQVWSLFFLATILVGAVANQAFGIGAVRQAVGGVHIDTSGTLRNVNLSDMELMRNAMAQQMEAVPGDLNAPNELRKVSLKRLEKAVAEHLASNKPLPDEMRFLAGLQSIKYVLVYPEQQDLVLVGHGEGWVVDKHGFVVGRTTGKPVLLLDDLTVALRAARQCVQGGGISCSIDPREAGLRSLREYASRLTDISQVSEQQIEQTLGMQDISVQGVASSTHFARVLVAADYRMKRIGMRLDPSPLPRILPSYIEMVSLSGRGMQNMTPRWWLTPNYPALLADPNGLAWELSGCSVKTMTDDTFFNADGTKKQAGAASSTAQLWANKMTDHYDELAKKEPIFAQLKNCMDLAVVASLIVKFDLAAKAGCSLFALNDPMHLMNESFETAKQVPSQVSVSRKNSGYIISASGGVEIRPAQFLNHVEHTSNLAPVVKASAPEAPKHWWWN
ncbi:MAG: DUF1598 domain-containing protein [Planctomycetes bacterium]|nr:DUF1598 domain-containing protein [Planctomycetota bacterium]